MTALADPYFAGSGPCPLGQPSDIRGTFPQKSLQPSLLLLTSANPKSFHFRVRRSGQTLLKNRPFAT